GSAAQRAGVLIQG
ncbi:hypothetical protein A2U01_0103990, partial [Trifolium medium]|nr:hypothetical protein [Trifolium medium]